MSSIDESVVRARGRGLPRKRRTAAIVERMLALALDKCIKAMRARPKSQNSGRGFFSTQLKGIELKMLDDEPL